MSDCLFCNFNRDSKEKIIQQVFHAHMHVIPRYSDKLYAGKGIRYWIKQPENNVNSKGTISL